MPRRAAEKRDHPAPPGMSGCDGAPDIAGGAASEHDGGLVERVALVLAGLANYTDVGATELARLLGMHTATVHRVLQALTRTGLVTYVPSRRTFALGERLLELGLSVQNRLPLRAEARSTLEALRDITGETAVLWACTDRGHISPVEQAITARRPRRESVLGHPHKLHQVKPGQLVLAHAPREFVDWYLEHVPLQPADPYRPLLEPSALRELLDHLAGATTHWGRSEVVADMNHLAFLLANADGAALGVIVVHGPPFRWTASASAAALPACQIEIQKLRSRIANLVPAFTWTPGMSPAVPWPKGGS